MISKWGKVSFKNKIKNIQSFECFAFSGKVAAQVSEEGYA
jgi:hypothetical protein